MRRGLWLGVLLFASVLWTFWPGINNEFVGYDDPLYVTANFHVQQGLTRESLKWAFSSGEAANWHPVTWISHMLDCQLFGLAAWGHHLTSIILHSLATVLLFVVLRSMTGSSLKSFLVAFCFGLHPLRVESVAWIAERKDVLSTLFWMLTLWPYAKYVERRGESGEGRLEGPGVEGRGSRTLHARRYYAATLGLYAIGLMSKPMLVTLPLVLLLLDYWPLGRYRGSRSEHGTRNTEHGTRIGMSNIERRTANFEKAADHGLRTLLWEKLPFFLLAAAMSVVTFAVQRSGGAIVEAGSFSHRIANALISYCRYLGKIVWPTDLAAFYPPAAHWPLWQVLVAGLFLACLSTLAVAWRRTYPWLLLGWLWFFGTLVPVIGLVPAGEQSMADRYSYVPSIGVLLVAVWGSFELAERWLATESWRRYPTGWRVILLIVAVGLGTGAAFCVTLTRKQIAYWKDTETLFRHAVQVTQNNYLAHNNIGTALDKRGHFEEALIEFRQALKAKPNYAEAYNNLGVVLGEQGRLEEALGQYAMALKLRPSYAEAHNNMGTILEKQGRLDEAIHEYQVAVQIRPDYPDAHSNLGAALGRKGRPDLAIMEFAQVLKLQPNSADTHNNLGVALDGLGRLDEAIDHFREAVRLKPDYARAHFNLGGALSRKGELDGAIVELKETLKLKPDYAAAQTNLAILLEMKTRLPGEKRGKE